MDELVHHCLRELSFDGDFGCSVSRLHDFIVDFYAHTGQPQNVDESFCAFVWSLVLQEPSVLVGTKPSGVVSEVWCAPQQKTLRKAKEEGVKEYGDGLRISLQPDAIYAAITGSHIRVLPKLSPMVYTALQIITRGRENGSGYDQKTCFYLVKQLIDLNIIVKVRRGGVGSHFCIHKYFFERSPVWSAIRTEENEAETRDIDAEQPEADIPDEDENQPVPESLDQLQFSPIDARHLSSLPLVRTRVLRLLKASKNYTHASNNLIRRIGFAHPTKTDRRFFSLRIRELIAQNLIEQVTISAKTSRGYYTSINCLRLVSTRNNEHNDPVPVPSDENPVGILDVDGAKEVEDREERQAGLKMNVTIHKQISDMLEDAGTSGMTLHEITSALLQFDRRTVELILGRAERMHPPAHLKDLTTVGLMETSGRERRNRYYTLSAYRELLAKEGLEDTSSALAGIELESTGGFCPVDEKLFYTDPKDLPVYQDRYKSDVKAIKGRTAKSSSSTKKAKAGKLVNPTMPDGTVKRGRPRKQPFDADGNVLVGKQPKTPRKRKREEGDEEGEAQPKKKRAKKEKDVPLGDDTTGVESSTANRKKRSRVTKANVAAATDAAASAIETGPLPSKADKPKGKRGRPPKPAAIASQPTIGTSALEESPPPKRPRLISPPINGSVDEPPVVQESVQMAPETVSAVVDAPPPPTDPTLAVEMSQPPDLDSMMPMDPLKRIRKTGPSTKDKTNVSHMRRENELLRCLEEAGGILATMSRELIEMHGNLLASLAASGQPASAPRTITAAFKNLEKRDKVRLTTTVVSSHTGVTRSVQIAQLPNVDQATINRYIRELSKNAAQPASAVVGPAVFNAMIEKVTWRKARGLRTFVVILRVLETLFAVEDTQIRDLYGFIHAKPLRARELHLLALAAFEAKTSSEFVVSSSERIMHYHYFLHDITLGQYLSIVPPLQHDDGARDILVKNLPQNILDVIRLYHSRSRTRTLDLFVTLHQLGIATITCPPKGRHPASFNAHSVEWYKNQMSLQAAAPAYFQFNSPVPDLVSASTREEAAAFWDALKLASTNADLPMPTPAPELSPLPSSDPTIRHTLLRGHAWDSEYRLTWHQRQYMNSLVDSLSGDTPLEFEDTRDAEVQRIAKVICSPASVVEDYFEINRAKKERRQRDEARQLALDQAMLARKAAEASIERVQHWDRLVEKVKPGPRDSIAQSRLSEVRMKFMLSPTHVDEEWEEKIIQAFKDAETANKRVLKIKSTKAQNHFQNFNLSSPITRPTMPMLLHVADGQTDTAPPLVSNPPEPDLRELIANQGPALPPESKSKSKSKKKGRGDQEEAYPGSERARQTTSVRGSFKGRVCYYSIALPITCSFPAVPRNTCRNKLSQVRDSPGEEPYLNRLEDRWHELWIKYHPSSTTKFDLVAHIEFLRRHIDKNALRAGLPFLEQRQNSFTLPATLDELVQHYDILESRQGISTPRWDFMWTQPQEEHRERKLLEDPISFHDTPLLHVEHLLDSEPLAEAGLKMVFGAPKSSYDPKSGAMILGSIGESAVFPAARTLLGRGVLSKREKNEPGSLPQNVFQDALSFDDSVSLGDEWKDWPLTASDGDLVALLELVSNDRVEFNIDTSALQGNCNSADWQSKKIDDDGIETALAVRISSSTILAASENEPSPESNHVPDSMDETEDAATHGFTDDGHPASCAQVTDDSVITCAACLNREWQEASRELSEPTKVVCRKVLEVIRQAGDEGISKTSLSACLGLALNGTLAPVKILLERPVPLLYWAGYTSVKLVSPPRIARWTVQLHDSPPRFCFPRRWLDTQGNPVRSVWEAGLRAVMSVAVFRPGISQSELRWRLRSIYDKQEVTDLIQGLVSLGKIRLEGESVVGWLLDDEEEKAVRLYVQGKPWYI
ncbi:hypothetical protein DL96DRAFT_1576137 [Flagelloscypha sp. PMI_526]|nr:hypothetical protein DL96DRAFT_1576137 [Flagelloscypha sp. PMI_526]